MKKTYFLLLLFIISCNQNHTNSNNKIIMTSSFPAASIIKEIVGEDIQVQILVPSGASPHTYTPKPSDIRNSSKAEIFVSIADNYDGWTNNFETKKHIELINFVQDSLRNHFEDEHNHEHNHTADQNHEHSTGDNNVDPHFWLDPIAVYSIIDKLSEEIIKSFPEFGDKFKSNADKFKERLIEFNEELAKNIEPIRNSSLFLQHPSFLYFAKRYGLIYQGAIEESPGKEPGPQFLKTLISKIKETKTKSIFSEPQLNTKVAEIISKETNTKLYIIDPVGSYESFRNYEDLLLQNSNTIKKALLGNE